MSLEVDECEKTDGGHDRVAESPSKPQQRKTSTKASVSTSPSGMKDFIKQKFRQVASTTRKSAISSGSTTNNNNNKNTSNSNSGSTTTSSTSSFTAESDSAMLRSNPFSQQRSGASSRDLSFDDLTKVNPPSMESNAGDGSDDVGVGTADHQQHKTTIEMKPVPVFSRDSRSMSLSLVPRLPPLSPPSYPNSPALRRSQSVSNPVVAGQALREVLPNRSLNFSALEASERSADDLDDLSLLDNNFPVTSPGPGALDESRSDLLTVVDDDVLLPVEAPFVQLHITDESKAVVLSPRSSLPEQLKKKKDKERQSKQEQPKVGVDVENGEDGQEQNGTAHVVHGDDDEQRSPKPPRSPQKSTLTHKHVSTPKTRSKHAAHPYSPPSSESPTKSPKDKKSPKTPTSKQSSRKKSSAGGGSKHRRSTIPDVSPLGTPSSSKVGKKQSVDANIAELVQLISPESSQKRSTYLQQFQHQSDAIQTVEGANGQKPTQLPPGPLSQHLPDVVEATVQDQKQQ